MGKTEKSVLATMVEDHFSKNELNILKGIGVIQEDGELDLTVVGKPLARASAVEVAEGHMARIGAVALKKGYERVTLNISKFSSGDVRAESNIRVLKTGASQGSRKKEDYFVNYVPNFESAEIRTVWNKLKGFIPTYMTAKGMI